MRLSFLMGLSLLLAACTGVLERVASPGSAPTAVPPGDAGVAPTRIPAEKYTDLEMVTLLRRDAIPAIDHPQFLTAAEADEFYDSDELVIGVEFDGQARAYSVPFLSNHEIVNDELAGVKFAVTW